MIHIPLGLFFLLFFFANARGKPRLVHSLMESFAQTWNIRTFWAFQFVRIFHFVPFEQVKQIEYFVDSVQIRSNSKYLWNWWIWYDIRNIFFVVSTKFKYMLLSTENSLINPILYTNQTACNVNLAHHASLPFEL